MSVQFYKLKGLESCTGLPRDKLVKITKVEWIETSPQKEKS